MRAGVYVCVCCRAYVRAGFLFPFRLRFRFRVAVRDPAVRDCV
uniref:Uncharacterized protein n=1 Tax=Anopheles dirus TaxID=7168 RepID=A0A182NYU8_9DIPT